jgi:hypothetical protein
MQFMLMVYQNTDRFPQLPNAEKRRISDACDTWFEKLKRTGHARSMNRLHDTPTAVTVRKSGNGFLVTDGPFAETKEVFGGYAIVECRDRAEALEVAKTFPGVEIDLAVEVRPIMTDAEEKHRWSKA